LEGRILAIGRGYALL
jgi:hypothetical protein